MILCRSQIWAVQMFTVISLAKYLLKNYNLLQTIMETLIEHSKTSKGKLSFPRSRQRNNPEFKRAQYMLFDLKYCLTAAPESWDDQLRKSFINGFKSFIEFIKFMHGMDALRRQTQQHIEFEPEWETSFNLLIKLQKSICSLIEWCSSDKVVYFECYKYLLNAIHQVETNDSLFTYEYEKCKLSGTPYEIINYSILKQEVSIHAPLTRLFAAIYSHLSKFSLNFQSIMPLLQSSTLNNHLSSLKHDLPRQKIINLLEPSIRALVLVSQTNAGLWKRNGFALLSQVYFYSNIKCRQEMFDRDILCLQMGASMMEPNEFLVNLLSRYGLFAFFTEENFELPSESLPDDLKLEYLIPMSEDFLELLIQVISERYEPFLSQIDSSKRLERECIHQLCVSPMAHSDLVKNVYPDNVTLFCKLISR
jgi:E3 ubiquitin-protein ligase UBR2